MSDEAVARLLTVEIDHAAFLAGDITLVRCHGKLVAGVTDILYTEVRPLIPNTKRIVLDLTDLTHMDSMGLGTVVRLYVSAKSAGCDLKLINLGRRIQQLLSITNLLSVFATIEESDVPIH
jgi:anti-sigma B factor antagonist